MALTYIGSITLNVNEKNLTAGVVDGDFIYYGIDGNPGGVVKVQMSTFTRTGSILYSDTTNETYSSDIQVVGSHVYTAHGSIGNKRIVKVTTAALSRIGALTTTELPVALISDGTDLYYGGPDVDIGIVNQASKIKKVSVSSFTETATLTVAETGYFYGYGTTHYDAARNLLYFFNTEDDSPFTTKLVRVSSTSFTEQSSLNYTGNTFNTQSNVAGDYLFITLFEDSPTIIYKLNLDSFTQVASKSLKATDAAGWNMLVQGEFLYIVTDTQLIKFRVSTLERVDEVSFSVSSSAGWTIHSDGGSNFFVGTYEDPAKVIKISDAGPTFLANRISIPHRIVSIGGVIVIRADSGLTGTSAVVVGATSATDFTVVNDQTLRVTIPAGVSTGSNAVQVTTGTGTVTVPGDICVLGASGYAGQMGTHSC